MSREQSKTTTDHDELWDRVGYINRCSDLRAVAKSAKANLQHENPELAQADLVDLRNRADSLIDDLEERYA